MKRLRHMYGPSTGFVKYELVEEGTSYTFKKVDNFELDIENDDHANILLQNEVFEDITPE